ncbi:MAG: 23S rRNA (adenine(2503)-C(2))-methyltransferase RlmN [Lachnospiraceae bacterium]|nr:23S rRNA (adenine(2503)-C(2))-methyltransferase RlmN [Lachnospiraceae bacterium]
MENIFIEDMSPEELSTTMEAMGEKRFRGAQIFEWLHRRLAVDYGEMTNLPGALRTRLAKEAPLHNLRIEDRQESADKSTRKYLYRLSDGHLVESVWMRYHHGNSVCISSQVGCRMGCRFCASTLDGLERNLRPYEMLAQIYGIIRDTGERVSNVVVMGMGEPLDNYDHLLRFLSLITCEKGQNISQRGITVSTCGLVPAMKRLAEERLQITLAVSLHGSTEEKRRALMPVANRYDLKALMEACRYYFDRTGRRITFEYALAAGVNDGKEEIRELKSLLKGLNCHINLIPINPVRERDFGPSCGQTVAEFKAGLEAAGLQVTVRRQMGGDIEGACGQLRRRHTEA